MCDFRAAGKSLDNETFSGEIKIPNLSDENEMEDVDVSFAPHPILMFPMGQVYITSFPGSSPPLPPQHYVAKTRVASE